MIRLFLDYITVYIWSNQMIATNQLPHVVNADTS